MSRECESDSQDDAFPKGFLQLFSSATTADASEALIILFHGCMIDVGFIPVNVPESNVHSSLPEGWQSGTFQYCHKTCTHLTCWMTCVPLFANISVQGTLDNGAQESVHVLMKTAEYLNDQSGFSDAEKLFIHRKKLIRIFKDEFCYPLLALLQESADIKPSFGISITVDEVKMYIFKLLPVQSILSFSRVNKEFNRVCNSPDLWKYLLHRDFGLVDIPSSTSEIDYKEAYKNEYLKKKYTPRRSTIPYYYSDPYYFPTIYPDEPRIYVDPRIDLDPALQQVFPHLRDRLRRRLRPDVLYPPFYFPGRFM